MPEVIIAQKYLGDTISQLQFRFYGVDICEEAVEAIYDHLTPCMPQRRLGDLSPHCVLMATTCAKRTPMLSVLYFSPQPDPVWPTWYTSLLEVAQQALGCEGTLVSRPQRWRASHTRRQ